MCRAGVEHGRPYSMDSVRSSRAVSCSVSSGVTVCRASACSKPFVNMRSIVLSKPVNCTR